MADSKEITGKRNVYIETLQNPYVILCSLVLGVLVGIFTPEFARKIEVVGRLYFFLLEMSVIPILMTAIISAVAKIISQENVSALIRKILLTLIAFWLLVSTVGAIGGWVTQVGVIKDKAAISTLVSDNDIKGDVLEISLKDNFILEELSLIEEVILSIVPRNIFESLVASNTLALVFFSIIVGIAAGIINNVRPITFISFVEELFEIFKIIIKWVLCVLPFALISLVSFQIATTGTGIFKIMLKFIVVFYILVAVVVVINTIIIWKASKTTLMRVLKAIADPIIVALVTRNSFAALASSVNSLSNKLPFNKNSIALITPLGTAIGRFGNILFYAYAAQFSLQLYGIPFSIGQLFFCTLLAILCGIASTGATGIATLTIISVILSPLGVPTEAVIVIFIVVDPIIDPIRSLLIVHTNLALSAAVSSVENEIPTTPPTIPYKEHTHKQ